MTLCSRACAESVGRLRDPLSRFAETSYGMHTAAGLILRLRLQASCPACPVGLVPGIALLLAAEIQFGAGLPGRPA